jgi:glycosyltransferase involved in cell wall biosynthesis
MTLKIRLHLTNVTGMGSSQLLLSLLPAFERLHGVFIETIYLPDSGPLATYKPTIPGIRVAVYRRYLPRALSRVFECLFFARCFDGPSPLLVFGDLPLFCKARQTLFVQSSLLFKSSRKRKPVEYLKYAVSRWIFKLNSKRVEVFIVQTELMRKSLEDCFPNITGRVYVASQPVPSWLLDSRLRRNGRVAPIGSALNLIYPAAPYRHKNHLLLSKIHTDSHWPIEQLQLTLDFSLNPAPNIHWVKCRGQLSATKMIEAYSEVDALLFLSEEESYGFPLLEAMFVGLPIICPDLPYARTLCGEQACYFSPSNIDSLKNAVEILKNRIDSGWWPNWESQIKNTPTDWESVALRMFTLAAGDTKTLETK